MSNSYISSSELYCLITTLFLIFFMRSTKPQKTRLYKINYCGAILSVINLLLEMAISIMAENHLVYFNSIIFDISMCFFISTYTLTVALIVSYLIRLASNTRYSNHSAGLLDFIVCSFFIACSVICSLTGKFYEYDCDLGIFDFTFFIRYYISLGIAGSIFVFIATVVNHKKFSSVVFRLIVFFVPFELLILCFQFLYSKTFCSGISYVFPLMVFYILFHSNPFDDSTGCQNRVAFDAQMADLIDKKQNYTVSIISVPKLEAEDYSNYIGKIEIVRKIYAETCHCVEQTFPGCRIFRLSTNSFAHFYLGKDNDIEKIKFHLNVLKHILTEACAQVANRVYFKMYSFQDNSYVNSVNKMHKMCNYLEEKIGDKPVSTCYIAKDEDYKDFAFRYDVEQLLFNIRNAIDLDDPRIVLYIQPIYDVNSKTFRTGEALMRLINKDGNFLPPDLFIPIAERVGCIHSLTRIILNKVCKQISSLKNEYNFDSITVNFSSAEFSDKNLYREILQSLKAHDIDPSYIRIELTESAMFDDYDTVRLNMEYLRKAGIKFYLDDFGTGYSNLERIVTLPFHTIKFDKSLLEKSMQDLNMKELVVQMIQVFKKKHFQTLIEGVETEEQAQFSMSLGFEFIQGFKYSKPVPANLIHSFFIKK